MLPWVVLWFLHWPTCFWQIWKGTGQLSLQFLFSMSDLLMTFSVSSITVLRIIRTFSSYLNHQHENLSVICDAGLKYLSFLDIDVSGIDSSLAFLHTHFLSARYLISSVLPLYLEEGLNCILIKRVSCILPEFENILTVKLKN